MSADNGRNKRQRISKDSAADQDGSSSRPIEILDSAANSQERSYIPKDDNDATKISISPPPARSKVRKDTNHVNLPRHPALHPQVASPAISHTLRPPNQRAIASPLNLSTVQGLSKSCNIDTVSLRDIFGDPLIKECWLFNYLFDVDFIM
ncbi:MAG: hypothetical protein Q9220_005943 [cf. Caloplaca sp. 1 TL-2023]